jgi:hypothetical protein
MLQLSIWWPPLVSSNELREEKEHKRQAGVLTRPLVFFPRPETGCQEAEPGERWYASLHQQGGKEYCTISFTVHGGLNWARSLGGWQRIGVLRNAFARSRNQKFAVCRGSSYYQLLTLYDSSQAAGRTRTATPIGAGDTASHTRLKVSVMQGTGR